MKRFLEYTVYKEKLGVSRQDTLQDDMHYVVWHTFTYIKVRSTVKNTSAIDSIIPWSVWNIQ